MARIEKIIFIPVTALMIYMVYVLLSDWGNVHWVLKLMSFYVLANYSLLVYMKTKS
jgi:hypothetical protein